MNSAVFVAVLLFCIALSIRGEDEEKKVSTTAHAPLPQRTPPFTDVTIALRGSNNKKPTPLINPNQPSLPNQPSHSNKNSQPNKNSKPNKPTQPKTAKTPTRPKPPKPTKPRQSIAPNTSTAPIQRIQINGSSVGVPLVAITTWNAGRLGNAMDAATKALRYALKHRCDVLLPDTLIGLPNYTTPVRHFYARDFPPTAVNASVVNASACDRRHSSHVWFYEMNVPADEWSAPLIVSRLRSYVGVNATHSLGQACPMWTCIGVHVRSGDVFAGEFNLSTGHWTPASTVHALYEQPPLEYYLTAIRSFVERLRQRTGGAGQPQVLVACEDLLNPVCAVLSVVAKTDRSWTIVRRDLITTLRTLTCCEEVVLSRSTLSLVLSLSPRLRHLHQYDGRHDCATLRHLGYNVTSYTAVGYNLSAWHNTELERHNMLSPYDMDVQTCAYLS